MKKRLEIKTLQVGQMAANCYICVSAGEAIIIDPGDDAQYIIETVSALGVTPTCIIATHGHFDHIMAAFEVQETFKIPFLLHPEDAFLVARMRETAEHFLNISIVEPPPHIDGTLSDGQSIPVGEHTLQIMHTPGHTPGSVCIFSASESTLFTGDTVFADGNVGRTDFSYSRISDLRNSIANIITKNASHILPGHGRACTTEELVSYDIVHIS